MDIKEQILVALGLNKAEKEIKLAWQGKSEDGTIFVSTAEELESGVDISVLTEDGTTILLPQKPLLFLPFLILKLQIQFLHLLL